MEVVSMKGLLAQVGGWLIILTIALMLLWSNGSLKEELGKRGVEISSLITKQDALNQELTGIKTLLEARERISKEYIIQNSIVLEDVKQIKETMREGFKNVTLTENDDCKYIPKSIDGLLIQYETEQH